jgi:hypothetical protein
MRTHPLLLALSLLVVATPVCPQQWSTMKFDLSGTVGPFDNTVPAKNVVGFGVQVPISGTLPMRAQRWGTLEFGMFGSTGSLDNNVAWNDIAGGGARLGFYVSQRLSAELEGAALGADRPLRSWRSESRRGPATSAV